MVEREGKMILFQRWFRYEFWPFWLFYIPTYFYWAFLAIRARMTTYFTTANPSMNNGGAVNVSKYGYMKQLPAQWVPRTLYFDRREGYGKIRQGYQNKGLFFPMILKPDRGERGKGVNLLHNEAQLKTAIQAASYNELLLQEYCMLPHETGILFFKYPHKKEGKILSITTKVFCEITGDGKHSWGELMLQNPRIVHRRKELQKTWKSIWNKISDPGQKIKVEPIGSHNRGTKFMDGRSMITPLLTQQVNDWANQLPGFYFGRFDLKFNSWEELAKGKSFCILEINGVNAEPTHIYDPNYSISRAYRDIFFQMKIIYEISRYNLRLGITPKPLKLFLIELIQTARR